MAREKVYKNEFGETLSAAEKAREICWEACEVRYKKDAVPLVKKALEIDPDCVEAYNILGFHEKNTEKKLDYYKKAYDLFIANNGEDFFKDHAGGFWIIVETRPFMRAAFSYGACLWRTGRRSEAINVYTDMLRLNPNDNQGVRFILTSWLIITGEFAKARKIIDDYERCPACLIFDKLLIDILESNDATVVKKSFEEAAGENAFIPLYILNKKQLPKKSPGYCGFGDENEALTYMLDEYGKDLWDAYPDAVKAIELYAQSE